VLHRALLVSKCPVPASPGAQPRIFLVFLTLRPRPSTGGGWRAKQSWRVHRSPPWNGCFARHWPRSTATFFIRFRSVLERRTKNSSHTLNGFLCAYLRFCVLLSQLLSQGSVDVIVLQVKVTRAREAITATEAARAAVVLPAETSVW
jgi:hypothetical protein